MQLQDVNEHLALVPLDPRGNFDGACMLRSYAWALLPFDAKEDPAAAAIEILRWAGPSSLEELLQKEKWRGASLLGKKHFMSSDAATRTSESKR